MEHPIDRSMRQLSDSEKTELIENITEIAYYIFEECGSPDDFCVQNTDAGLGSIVFGGFNRLILDESGWSISEPHCNPKFIEKFNRRYKR